MESLPTSIPAARKRFTLNINPALATEVATLIRASSLASSFFCNIWYFQYINCLSVVLINCSLLFTFNSVQQSSFRDHNLMMLVLTLLLKVVSFIFITRRFILRVNHPRARCYTLWFKRTKLDFRNCRCRLIHTMDWRLFHSLQFGEHLSWRNHRHNSLLKYTTIQLRLALCNSLHAGFAFFRKKWIVNTTPFMPYHSPERRKSWFGW